MKMKDDYKTTDIVLAAYLRINQCAMLGIEKQGQKGTFIFENVPDELLKLYHLGNASVEPILFNNMVKQLATSVRNVD
jgi:hypothetical protein